MEEGHVSKTKGCIFYFIFSRGFLGDVVALYSRSVAVATPHSPPIAAARESPIGCASSSALPSRPITICTPSSSYASWISPTFQRLHLIVETFFFYHRP